ncbi:MAG: Bax inhibitor-1/YccA family protein [Succinivibrio sp.]|nr:Bax inhibitor-1/YccA family protein [Succinivibrio sp.]
MNLTQTSNPAVAVATRQAGSFNFGGTEAAATISGSTTKSLVYILITLVVGYFSMAYALNGYISNGALIGSCLVAFIVALVTIFKPQFAPVTGPIYAVTEGVALGMLSGIFEYQYPGIVVTAVMSTFVVVMVMLVLWKFKLIVPTQRFRSIVVGATAAICVLYLLNFIFMLFGSALLPSSGPLSIAISLVVCLIAALNLVLDFEAIQSAVDQGLPKYFEAFNAFSLLVTICWLYIEILKLLAKRED